MGGYSGSRKDYSSGDDAPIPAGQKEKYYGKLAAAQEETPVAKKDVSFVKTYDISKGGGFGMLPVFTEDRIYVGSMDYHMYCIDKNGKFVWKFPTGGVIISSPCLWKGKLYFTSNDSHIYCTDTDGRLVWKYRTGGMIPGSPAIVGDRLYAGSGDGMLYCLDAETGRKIWAFATGDAIANTPAFANDKIYFGSFDGYFYSITNDGKLAWKQRAGDAVGGMSCPVITDSRFRPIFTLFTRAVDKPPEAKEGRVLYGSRDKNIYCRDLEGRLVWSFMTGGLTGNLIEIKDSRIYFGSFDGYFYCIDSEGKEVWKARAGGPISMSMNSIYGGAVFFTSFDNSMYAADINTGQILWTFQTGNACATACIEGGKLYVSSLDTMLYCIDIKNRKVEWTFQSGFAREVDAKEIVSKLVEYDRKILKVWKPETAAARGSVEERKYSGTKADIPEGFTYGGEQTYTSQSSYSMGSKAYTGKKEKKDRL